MWSEDVKFKSLDIDLAGKWYFPVNTSQSNKRPVVILTTGLGGNKEWFEPLTENVVGEGFAVFCFDFRGHGQSGGVCDENLDKDIEAAIEVVKKHPLIDSSNMFMAGQCMGGVMALHKANRLGNIKGIGIFAPLSEQRIVNTPGAWDKVMEAMRDPENPHRVDINEESFLKLYTTGDVFGGLELREIPVFMSFCTDDKYLTGEILGKLCERASRTGDYIFIKDGGRHTAGYREGAIGKRFCYWLTQTLKVAGGE